MPEMFQLLMDADGCWNVGGCWMMLEDVGGCFWVLEMFLSVGDVFQC